MLAKNEPLVEQRQETICGIVRQIGGGLVEFLPIEMEQKGF
jgi:hypothetical protein